MNIINGCATLRAIEESDFDLLFYMMNAPEIEEGTEGWHLPISSIQQKDWMRTYRNSDTDIRLMIELSNGKTIGMISLTDINWKNRTALVGYKIHAALEDRIKGDMVDALKGILDYAFNELGMNSISATVLEDNIFSSKLIKRLHFQQDGILRQRVYKKGTFKDLTIWSLLREEFNTLCM